jgi:beta-galactosidase
MFVTAVVGLLAGAAAMADPRTIISLHTGWQFHQGDLTQPQAQTSDDPAQWTSVTVPQTWNRIGNVGYERASETNHYHGPSWYRLTFTPPASAAGKRAFLQFDGVGEVAEVWLNGQSIGRHEGAFSRFRFDITSALKPQGSNVLFVRADNSKPARGSATENVIPLAGDFVIFGGLYREVSLIFTNPVHIDMGDFGGPGIYGRVLEISAENATVSVRKRIVDDGRPVTPVRVETRIEDSAGNTVAKDEQRVRPAQGSATTVETTLKVPHPRLWQGTADPYLYRMVVTLRSQRGEVLDQVVQPLGLRTMKFDPNTGFSLNGEPLRLLGASMHQDRPVKGWALSRADRVADFDLLQEIGGTAVRLAHYQHDQIAYDLADARGIVVWAEIPVVTMVSLDNSPPTAALVANARQQLTELIRQNFNHPSVAMWSIGNEVDLRATTQNRSANAHELLRGLNALAKQEDPGRPTTLADCCEPKLSAPGSAPAASVRETVVGITDIVGYNRYFGWYSGAPRDLGPALDEAHARHPQVPMAVSEYGAGAALTQHTDNPLGGPINPHGRPHPEEVQLWFHEESWKQLDARRYLWGAFIWNMFDFASEDRSEGDLQDINEKGLVSYDRGIKKDVFYFYKANWSRAPTLHLVGRRYGDRAYGVVAVKAYSSAARATLSVNGNDVGSAACEAGICVWPNVRLISGMNEVVARAESGATSLQDAVQWIYSGSPGVVRIKAGDLSGYIASEGVRYGSDNFFIGGTGRGINAPDTPSARRVAVEGTPDARLYDSYRVGSFAYEIPVPDGTYTVTARFTEPSASAKGERVFDVLANGRVALANVDVFALSGGRLKPFERSFTAEAKSGRLRLEFRGSQGEAVVSALEVVNSSLN